MENEPFRFLTKQQTDRVDDQPGSQLHSRRVELSENDDRQDAHFWCWVSLLMQLQRELAWWCYRANTYVLPKSSTGHNFCSVWPRDTVLAPFSFTRDVLFFFRPAFANCQFLHFRNFMMTLLHKFCGSCIFAWHGCYLYNSSCMFLSAPAAHGYSWGVVICWTSLLGVERRQEANPKHSCPWPCYCK